MSEKIKIEKGKKRIPLPKKPPKIAPKANAYDREKEKDKIRKKKSGDE